MSFPNKVMSGSYLSGQDKADLLFGIENDVDFVAASFVSTKEDAVALRRFLNAEFRIQNVLDAIFHATCAMDVMFYKAMACAKAAFNLQPGDNVVLTGCPINGQSGNTNTIKVE